MIQAMLYSLRLDSAANSLNLTKLWFDCWISIHKLWIYFKNYLVKRHTWGHCYLYTWYTFATSLLFAFFNSKTSFMTSNEYFSKSFRSNTFIMTDLVSLFIGCPFWTTPNLVTPMFSMNTKSSSIGLIFVLTWYLFLVEFELWSSICSCIPHVSL